MKIYGYGEDALTLWVLRHRLDAVLNVIDDGSDTDSCVLFYRPSFGRRGGEESPQFGEFDFILLTQERLVLGESKWDRSPERSKDGLIRLRPEQLARHMQFRHYVQQWMTREHKTWDEFHDQLADNWNATKPLAPPGSLLSQNLTRILMDIQSYFGEIPVIDDVLLYMYDGTSDELLPTHASDDLKLVAVDYSSVSHGNYIQLWR